MGQRAKVCGSTATTSTANSRASRPPHHGFRDFDALLIRKSDSKREEFSWSHGQIAGKAAAGTREVPDNALALEWSSVVCDRALHGKAAKGTNREGHRHLAGRRVLF